MLYSHSEKEVLKMDCEELDTLLEITAVLKLSTAQRYRELNV